MWKNDLLNKKRKFINVKSQYEKIKMQFVLEQHS